MLNSYFVPVYASNEKYWKGGVNPEEAAALRTITTESINKNLGYGDVHVFLVGPDGHVRSSIGVVRATQNDNLKKFLEAAVRDWNLTAGAPVMKPRAQSRPPGNAPAGSLVLHGTSRGSREGDWREFPAENWIVLTPDDTRKLLPPAGAKAGTQWEVDKAVAHKLLTMFYPQTEDTDSTDRNQFDEYWIKGKVISVTNGAVTARLDSQLQMRRSFYPGRKNLEPINAEILGFLKFSTGNVEALELSTVKATFSQEPFDAGLRSGYESPAP
jgi:hypothetical protein